MTVSCADGDTGFIYDGLLDFSVEETEITELPEAPVKVMMNVGTPEQAFTFAQLPNHGVGLARLEFIINRQIGIHPKALLNLDDQPPDVQRPKSGRRSPPTTARATTTSSAWPKGWRPSPPRSRPSR